MHVLWQTPRNKTLDSWQQLISKYTQVGPSMGHNDKHAHDHSLPLLCIMMHPVCIWYSNHTFLTITILQEQTAQTTLEPINSFVWCELTYTCKNVLLLRVNDHLKMVSKAKKSRKINGAYMFHISKPSLSYNESLQIKPAPAHDIFHMLSTTQQQNPKVRYW